jgi:Alcohol dehydrogenase transcription factor Myb/SANT-like
MAKRNDCDLQLIELVKQRPALWDSRLDEYKLTEKKETRWNEILDSIGPSTGSTVGEWYVSNI